MSDPIKFNPKQNYDPVEAKPADQIKNSDAAQFASLTAGSEIDAASQPSVENPNPLTEQIIQIAKNADLETSDGQNEAIRQVAKLHLESLLAPSGAIKMSPATGRMKSEITGLASEDPNFRGRTLAVLRAAQQK